MNYENTGDKKLISRDETIKNIIYQFTKSELNTILGSAEFKVDKFFTVKYTSSCADVCGTTAVLSIVTLWRFKNCATNGWCNVCNKHRHLKCKSIRAIKSLGALASIK